MALHFKTTDPNKLLTDFKKAIDDGRIVTWSYDSDNDFTHTAEQWKYSAWLRPKKLSNDLVFTIIKPKNKNISTEIYAIYHGRFAESMLVHCDKLFSEVISTAMPAEGDLIS